MVRPPGKAGPRDGDDTTQTDLESASAAGIELHRSVWTIVDGPQKGTELRVEGEPIRIGAAAGNAIRLVDPKVSRYHAEVVRSGPGLLLRDLDSRNGTFVEGQRVKEAFLSPGCRIRMGATTLVFQPAGAVAPDARAPLAGLVGEAPSMRALLDMLRRAAQSDVTVVLTGETGTGKEMAARAIHAASPRAAAPFAVLDCAAVDRELVSSELFGHEPGAFTGAVSSRPGAFEQAHRGTLFLDELGELPLELQAKLLRVLEQREIRRLGSTRSIPVDCRIVAATHRDLAAMVAARTFREDLYYRVAQVVITLPPLRDRREDIPLLVESFRAALRAAGGAAPRFSRPALDALCQSPLPGNVRELRNIVRRACAMAAGPEIEVADLGVPGAPAVPAPPDRESGAPDAGTGSLLEAERETILRVLRKHHWHRERAAAELGITRQTLRLRMRRHDIEVPERGSGS